MVELQRTSRAVCCAKWSPDENKFAIGSSDKNIGICYYETEQRFWAAEMIKKKPKSTITSVAWHPNNQLLAVGSLDYRVRIYSAFVKAVDGQPQTSAWGKIANTGDLLHEFPCGNRFFVSF
jgi:actin related protein 2/3 complex subunit 1A/1B